MDPLFSIPSATLAFSLLPFLDSVDWLALRATCSKAHKLFHEEAESEVIWRGALYRDFAIDDAFYPKTLRVSVAPRKGLLRTRHQPSGGLKSFFGFSPSESVFDAATAFDSWKSWRKARSRYYKASPHCTNESVHFPGPYFLRAAALWSKIEKWCGSPESGSIGNTMLKTFLPGLGYSDWPATLRHHLVTGQIFCLQGIYSFCGGQDYRALLENPGGDMFGGYAAYDYHAFTAFLSPQPFRDDSLCIQIALCDSDHVLPKCFCVFVPDGELMFCSGETVVRAVDPVSPSNPRDGAILWFEEYAARLQNGTYRVIPMANDANAPNAVALYPQVSLRSNREDGIPVVGRAVTRGVEVVASAVYTPQCVSSGMGFIYSIRIRLLSSEDGDEYVSPTERGFDRCQLRTRHWKITDSDTGTSEQVNGDGVVGMYPLLYEGGHELYAGLNAEHAHHVRDMPGSPFTYQSCTSEMQGSFEGFLRFVPGSLDSPEGDQFNVEVAPFALDTRPLFLY